MTEQELRALHARAEQTNRAAAEANEALKAGAVVIAVGRGSK